MTTPIWLLNVDGVLNAVVRATPKGYVEGQADGWTIKFNPAIIAQIEKWHQEKLVEVRWLTTWADRANDELRRLLGFSQEFTVVAAPPFLEKHGWWKFEEAQALRSANPDVPLIWTDDDLALEPDALAWAKEGNVLVIAPSMYTGLVDSDMYRIEAFLKRVNL